MGGAHTAPMVCFLVAVPMKAFKTKALHWTFFSFCFVFSILLIPCMKFGSTYLGKATSATRAALPSAVLSVDLGKATAAARAALPSPTSVCDVLVFNWVRLQQPQEQRYTESQSYQCMRVCDVFSVETWVRLQQPQEQRYPVLPTYSISTVDLSWCNVYIY